MNVLLVLGQYVLSETRRERPFNSFYFFVFFWGRGEEGLVAAILFYFVSPISTEKK